MTLQWGGREEAVRVLLDTGCSVPLISKETVRRTGIAQERKNKPTPIRNCSREEVPGRGEKVTGELVLRHHRHYTREIFEVAPLEPGVDVFLPFWWISQHPPQGAWESVDMRFSSPHIRKKKSPFQRRPVLDALRALGKILDSNLALIGSWHAGNSQHVDSPSKRCARRGIYYPRRIPYSFPLQGSPEVELSCPRSASVQTLRQTVHQLPTQNT